MKISGTIGYPSVRYGSFAGALVAAVAPGPERSARLLRARRAAERWSWERSAEQLETVWLDAARE